MLIYDQIIVDTNLGIVTYDHEIISLHPKEYQLLLLFLNNPNQIITYDFIIDQIWDMEEIPTYSTIRTHIKCIRKAFQKAQFPENLIENVYGMGYRLNSSLKSTSKKNGFVPALSIFKDILNIKGIEYLAIDDEFIIHYLSPGLNNYCDYPEYLQIGVDAGNPFPELIGFEQAFEQVRQSKKEKFEVKGIARACNPNRPEYINISAILYEPKNIENGAKKIVLVLFENASEQMIYKQRLVQLENQIYLALDAEQSHPYFSKTMKEGKIYLQTLA